MEVQYTVYHVKGNRQTKRDYFVGDDGKMSLGFEEVELIDKTLIDGDHIIVYVGDDLVEERKL